MTTRRTTRDLLLTLVGCSVVLAACGDDEPTGPDTARIEVEPILGRVVETGDSVHFRAFEVQPDGSRSQVDVSWSVAVPSVATISDDGIATALEIGATTVLAARNGLEGQASFVVNPDTFPPLVRSVVATPSRVNVQNTAVVRIDAEFEDDGSGVSAALATFDGPRGGGITGLVSLEPKTEEDDGVGLVAYEGFLEIPANADGIWTMSGLRAEDRAGNLRVWGDAELESMGMSVVITAIGGN